MGKTPVFGVTLSKNDGTKKLVFTNIAQAVDSNKEFRTTYKQCGYPKICAQLWAQATALLPQRSTKNRVLNVHVYMPPKTILNIIIIITI